jgi:hypothetical protein
MPIVVRHVAEMNEFAGIEDALEEQFHVGGTRPPPIVGAPPGEVAVAPVDDANDAPAIVIVNRRLGLVGETREHQRESAIRLLVQFTPPDVDAVRATARGRQPHAGAQIGIGGETAQALAKRVTPCLAGIRTAGRDNAPGIGDELGDAIRGGRCTHGNLRSGSTFQP